MLTFIECNVVFHVWVKQIQAPQTLNHDVTFAPPPPPPPRQEKPLGDDGKNYSV